MSESTIPLITVEEFAALPQTGDELEELIGGGVYRSPVPGLNHGECLGVVAFRVREHVKAHSLGRCTIRSGMVAARSPDSVLCPDFSFWSADRPPDVVKGWPTVPPRLVAEVIENLTDFRDAMRKLPYYFSFGIEIFWLVWIQRRVVEVHQLASHPQPFDQWEWRHSGYGCRSRSGSLPLSR